MGLFKFEFNVDANEITDPKTALIMARILWFALVAGLTFVAVIFAMGFEGESPRSLNSDSLLLGVVGVFTLVTVFVGRWVRGGMFKKGRVDGVVSPRAYLIGNAVAWACYEGPAFFGLIVTVFFASALFPMVIFPLVAYVTLPSQFPTGKGLRGADAGDPYTSSPGDRYGPDER